MAGNRRLTVNFNLFNLRQQLEMHQHRRIPWSEVAATTGLNQRGLERMARNEPTRISLINLEALLNFFRDAGMPIGIEQLLLVSESDPNHLVTDDKSGTDL